MISTLVPSWTVNQGCHFLGESMCLSSLENIRKLMRYTLKNKRQKASRNPKKRGLKIFNHSPKTGNNLSLTISWCQFRHPTPLKRRLRYLNPRKRDQKDSREYTIWKKSTKVWWSSKTNVYSLSQTIHKCKMKFLCWNA